MKPRMLLVATLALVAGACSHHSTAPIIGQPAPETITIAGVRMYLQAHLVRDFMPVYPPGGPPLNATLLVHSVNGVALPAGLAMSSVVVYNDGQTWQSIPQNQQAPDPTTLMSSASGGPTWEVGTVVDVVVALSYQGEVKLLARRGQVIQRVD